MIAQRIGESYASSCIFAGVQPKAVPHSSDQLIGVKCYSITVCGTGGWARVVLRVIIYAQ